MVYSIHHRDCNSFVSMPVDWKFVAGVRELEFCCLYAARKFSTDLRAFENNGLEWQHKSSIEKMKPAVEAGKLLKL